MRLDAPTPATKPTRRVCRKCGEEKNLEDFCKHDSCSWGYSFRCAACRRLHANKYWERTKDTYHHVQAARRLTARGKALDLLHHMQSYSRKHGFSEPEFTWGEIEQIVQGSCAKSGMSFRLDYKSTTGRRNPWAPSPDRIDPNEGYTKENVQWVCWMYNLMKGDFSEEEVSLFVNSLRTFQ